MPVPGAQCHHQIMSVLCSHMDTQNLNFISSAQLDSSSADASVTQLLSPYTYFFYIMQSLKLLDGQQPQHSCFLRVVKHHTKKSVKGLSLCSTQIRVPSSLVLDLTVFGEILPK